MKSKIIKSTGIFLVAIMAVNVVLAAGVSMPYWNENPLVLVPGESKIVGMGIQNKMGGEDMRFKASITGESIATIIDDSDEYFVPFGSDAVPVNVKVTAPENSEIGKIYDVFVSFKPISDGDGGMVKMTGAFTAKIPVKIADPTPPEPEAVGESTSIEEAGEIEESGNNLLMFLAILGALVIFVAVFIAKKNKGKKK